MTMEEGGELFAVKLSASTSLQICRQSPIAGARATGFIYKVGLSKTVPVDNVWFGLPMQTAPVASYLR